MKKLLVLLLLATAQSSVAQVQKGQLVPTMTFPVLLNAPTQATTLSQLKGKLVLIDFWATWCGPCLEALPHLQELQRQYAQQLQVITVTDETPKRIRQYLTARPSNLWVALDSAHAFSRLFPHQLIPHTILISTDGRLLGSTTPQAVTSQIIDSLLQQQPVHLPEKKDNVLSVAQVIQTYYKVTGQEKSRFMLQGEMTGLPSVRTTHLNDSTFKNRRLTCLNLPLTMLYQFAYGDVPYGRLIDKTTKGSPAPVYCLDLIVATPDDLLPTLQQELASRFDVQTKMEAQAKDVQVLTITNRLHFDRIPRNQSGKRTYSARPGELDQQSMTMADLANYLENYGMTKGLVVDETMNHEKLDIKFSFQPENPQSLLDSLAELGLGLSKQTRTINMLVLYQ
ncbi:redoxin family protein [Spirosoma sp.]|uniref:redoxin family protein n=1 Tax=Spirosoma sp. TaxID=1899569 RepID=UPI00260208C9|nr:redoxin family protein [Spirosoma sp.]MCX6213682.1 redoxin family protein [Spirosoma sp.]